MTPAHSHYDAAYVDFARSITALNAQVNREIFQPHISLRDRVLDFGCGTGDMLAILDCGDRLGVEVNEAARREAEHRGVRTVPSLSIVPDGWADVAISNSCLEHVEHPLIELRDLYRAVRPGGTLVIRVPNETTAMRYAAGDIDQHLYTWSPMNLGNLLTNAGFSVQSVRLDKNVWPPKPTLIHRMLGNKLFRIASRLYRQARVILSPVWPIDIHTMVIAVGRRPDRQET
jgi:SAM-dependent methyltransferase